jgi:hypothetical protein
MPEFHGFCPFYPRGAMPKPVGICNPVRNFWCPVGCRDLAQNISGGVANPAALRSLTTALRGAAEMTRRSAASLTPRPLERRVRRAGRETMPGFHGFCPFYPRGAMPKPVRICNPVRNFLCHVGCRDFAQSVSGGVANPAALRSLTPPFSRPHGRSRNEHTKRPRGSAGTAG